MFAIAIDGPAGAGKSTVAKAVAKIKGMHYVDTGAMYRTIGYSLLQNGIDVENEAEVEKWLPMLNIEIFFDDEMQHMVVNGVDVTGKIRTPEVGSLASKVAVLQSVREKVLVLERKLASEYEVIMDGRDIGTVVLPDAPCKIYLTASPEERGRRRFLELEEKEPGTHDLAGIIEEIRIRDYRDMNREHAPLKQAEDAILLDSTDFSLEESVEAVLKIAEAAKR